CIETARNAAKCRNDDLIITLPELRKTVRIEFELNKPHEHGISLYGTYLVQNEMEISRVIYSVALRITRVISSLCGTPFENNLTASIIFCTSNPGSISPLESINACRWSMPYISCEPLCASV